LIFSSNIRFGEKGEFVNIPVIEKNPEWHVVSHIGDENAYEDLLSNCLWDRYVKNTYLVRGYINSIAECYNGILRMVDGLVVFAHPDVSFSESFYDDAKREIEEGAGAVGLVGNFYEKSAVWANKIDKPTVVNTLDCCLIAFDSRLGIKFDEEIFDEYHCYVEDICCQIRKWGKEVVVVPNEGFVHASTTWSKNNNGSWGKYYRYRRKLINKWSPIISIWENPIPLSAIKSRDEIGSYLECHYQNGVGIEVGVQTGKYSESILKEWKSGTLYSVDRWEHVEGYLDVANVSQDEQDRIMESAKNRLGVYGERSIIVKMDSVEASGNFDDGSLDFVYIDADHSYEGCSADLTAWYPKVKKGGLIAGHDFFDGDSPNGKFEVESAVRDFLGSKFNQVVRIPSNGDGADSWALVKDEK
jgi:hypothetical protein